MDVVYIDSTHVYTHMPHTHAASIETEVPHTVCVPAHVLDECGRQSMTPIGCRKEEGKTKSGEYIAGKQGEDESQSALQTDTGIRGLGLHTHTDTITIYDTHSLVPRQAGSVGALPSGHLRLVQSGHELVPMTEGARLSQIRSFLSPLALHSRSLRWQNTRRAK